MGRTFDSGLSYEYLISKIMTLYNSFATIWQTERNKKTAVSLLYSATALTQLTNGLRSAEAVESMINFIRTREREFKIKAKKHGNERWVIIPRTIVWGDLSQAYGMVGRISLGGYRKWVKRKVGCNTHTLRYAFIRKCLSSGLNADRTAIIIGHRRLTTTYEYEKEYNSKEDLRKIVDGIV